MQLDGFPVEPGDRVFDLYFGEGTVKNITSDERAVITFGARMFTYDSRGIGQHGRRSLYWHNPVLTVPAKDVQVWDMQRNICKVIGDLLAAGPGVRR